jgi:hypothetical protein
MWGNKVSTPCKSCEIRVQPSVNVAEYGFHTLLIVGRKVSMHSKYGGIRVPHLVNVGE